MKRISIGFMLAFMIVFCWTAGIAGDFDVIPGKKQQSWDKKITGSARFKLVLDGEAVLDRETGLFWQRATDNDTKKWTDTVEDDACTYCYKLEVGGRLGWRLPTIEELATLVDTSNLSPALPAGHLFTNFKSSYYWSSSTHAYHPDHAWYVYFGNGYVYYNTKTDQYYVRCVRSGHGYDAP
jgi:hypothetical protein